MSKTKLDYDALALTAALPQSLSTSSAAGYGTLNSTTAGQAFRAYSYNGVNYGFVGQASATTGGSHTDMGIRSEAALVFGAGGFGEDMRLSVGGRLLIGTATDDNTSKLQVSGSISQYGAGAALIANGVSTSAKFITLGNGGGSGAGVGDLYIGKEGSTAGGFFTGSSAYANVIYSLATLQILQGGTKLQIDSNGAQLNNLFTATKFRSVTASAVAASGAATTLYAIPNGPPCLWLVSADIGAVGDATNYGAFAILMSDGATLRVVQTNNAAQQTITVSGLNVRSTQTSGAQQTINMKLTCLG